MMDYSFTIHGHGNILSTHPKTIEFTKDAALTRNGDCIVGVMADFSLEQLRRFLDLKLVRITIAVGDVSDSLTAVPNRKFSSDHEMVIRLGEFDSERTFAVRADKAAAHLRRDLVAALKRNSAATVTVSDAAAEAPQSTQL